jgi:hypothetical protein
MSWRDPRLDELAPEEQAQYAQRNATDALAKIKRLTERVDALERNLQLLANAVRGLMGHRPYAG